LTNSIKGRAEYNKTTKKVLISRGDLQIELPGEFENLEDAKAAALKFVERLRERCGPSTPATEIDCG
jgi:hypothetical protein